MNRKKVHDRGSYLFVYIYLFLVVIIFSHIVVLLANINFFHTDIHNAREMLGVLFESQATIIALVITLTLVAVQLTASEYSPRVVDIIRKDLYMWTLFVLYGISMLYDLILLKLVEGGEMDVVDQSVIWSYGPIPISFEWLVSSALLFGTFTFFALIPFILHTINLLKPENIINQLANEITKNKFLNSKEDRIQPIEDIIRGSIMNYDFETTRKGLEAVTNQVIDVIDLKCDKEISNSFCNRLQELGKLATSRADGESTKKVIENLKNFGESTANNNIKYASQQAANALGAVGKAATINKLKDATWKAISSLEVIGKIAVKKKLGAVAFPVVSSLEAVGKTAVDEGKKFKVEIEQAALSLGAVGEAAVENKYGIMIKRDALALKNIGEAAAKNKLEDVIPQVVFSLVAVGKTAANKGEEIEDATKKIAHYLAELTLLSKKIVETTISNYESNLKGADSSFQKFKDYYEQELEEMKANVSE